MVSTSCKKYLCCFYCIVLGISGVSWIAVSSVLLFRLLNYKIFIPGEAIGPFGLFLFIGFLHILITWIGWKGVTKEHSFHIIMFTILVVIIIACEIATGVWAMVLRDDIDLHAVGILDESFKEYVTKDFEKREWVKLQKQLQCCGINGPSGYEAKGTVPIVCCNVAKSTNTSSCVEMYQVGCKNPLINYIKGLLLSLALFAFVSGALQTIGVYAFCNLDKSLKFDFKENLRQRQNQPSAPNCPPNPNYHVRKPAPPIPHPR